MLLSAPYDVGEGADDEQHEKHEKADLGEACCRRGDAAESEQSGEQRNDKKSKRPIQQVVLPLKSTSVETLPETEGSLGWT